MKSREVHESLSIAFKEGRLAHAIMLEGGDIEGLRDFVYNFAKEHLLGECEEVAEHVDLFYVKPSNKMRQIGVEPMQELIANVYKSPKVGQYKVVLVEEADRMNASAANAFLKTLEEPPGNTVIFLLTSRVLSILPTIRSRCLTYRIECKEGILEHPGWMHWHERYVRWVEGKRGVVEAYGLLARFEEMLAQMVKELLKDFEGDEAQEAGLKRGSFRKMLQVITQTTTEALLESKTPIEVNDLYNNLETLSGLQEVNLNEMALLEGFFLEISKA